MAWLVGIRLYQAYERRAQEQADPAPTMTFNQVPVSFAPIPVETPVYRRWPEQGPAAEVVLQDAPLPLEAQTKQAQQTVESVLRDYAAQPEIQAFYKDLQAATGQNLSLADLSGDQLPALLMRYPQLQQVIVKHAQDPQFAKTLAELFANPQFVESVQVLQQNAHP